MGWKLNMYKSGQGGQAEVIADGAGVTRVRRSFKVEAERVDWMTGWGHEKVILRCQVRGQPAAPRNLLFVVFVRQLRRAIIDNFFFVSRSSILEQLFDVWPQLFFSQLFSCSFADHRRWTHTPLPPTLLPPFSVYARFGKGGLLRWPANGRPKELKIRFHVKKPNHPRKSKLPWKQ